MTTTGILAGVDAAQLQQAFSQAMVRDEVKHVTYDYTQGGIFHGVPPVSGGHQHAGGEVVAPLGALRRLLLRGPSAADVAHRARLISEAARKLSKTADEMRGNYLSNNKQQGNDH